MFLSAIDVIELDNASGPECEIVMVVPSLFAFYNLPSCLATQSLQFHRIRRAPTVNRKM